MLADYAGTLILISHDRDFLDRTVTSIIVPEGGGRWVEYAGGWSDMVLQRGSAPFAPPGEARRTAKPGRDGLGKKAQAGAEAKPKRRLSFKEKHALETLPATIARLEKEIAELQERLHDPALYARDRQAFETVSAALVQAQTALTEAEHRWLDLEILREELGIIL